MLKTRREFLGWGVKEERYYVIPSKESSEGGIIIMEGRWWVWGLR